MADLEGRRRRPRCTLATVSLQDAAADREVLHRSRPRPAASRHRRRSGAARGRVAHAPASGVAACRRSRAARAAPGRARLGVVIEPAADVVVRPERQQLRDAPRSSGATSVLDPGQAAGGEAAALRQVDEVGHAAGDDGQLVAHVADHGDRRRSGPRVYGWRGSRNSGRVSVCSTISPGVHHGDPVAHLRDDAQVVGDEDDRRPESPRAGVRIRSRIWAWMVTSRAVVGSSAMSSSGSQASAIAIITRWRHAARHLVRVGLDPPLGVGDADHPEQLDRPRSGPPCGSCCGGARATSPICVADVAAPG